jgi:hypothetical protein
MDRLALIIVMALAGLLRNLFPIQCSSITWRRCQSAKENL